MGHPIPKELTGEERLFVIPWLNVPVTKKSIIYNGPATLIAILIGKITGSITAFMGVGIILNVIVYPLGNNTIGNNKFNNGGMSYDKYLIQKIKWELRGGGNIYIGHHQKEEGKK